MRRSWCGLHVKARPAGVVSLGEEEFEIDEKAALFRQDRDAFLCGARFGVGDLLPLLNVFLSWGRSRLPASGGFIAG